MDEERKTRIFGLERDQLGRLFSAGMDELDEDGGQVAPGGADFASSLKATLERVGQSIGPYRLARVLGEGGMGIVYLAEQERPMRRQVALKVIKPGMDSQRVIARFAAERQALALLDHPNIAHVHDAGTTDSGRPYFVMEYVEGLPLTEHCDRHQLGIKARLALFQEVCHAIQHAHEKGIIHRDIKPSNILVATQGTRAVPKIIDFGVAKAIAQPLAEKTLLTEQGRLFGTPEYMSPEQADPGNEDIDTRSDVYSLGVLLYVLLTGVLPFDTQRLRSGGLEHVRRTLRDTDPRTPSTRLVRLGAEADAVAQSRNTDVATLARHLRRELEWIPLKAMRKDRTQRYRSAAEASDDIDNYLHGRPLLAGPPGTVYRILKFVRRHRALVGAFVATGLVLLVGLIVSLGLYLKAERASADAQAVADFLERDLMMGLAEVGWGNMTFDEALEQAVQKLGTKFPNQPLVEAAIRWRLSTFYSGAGHYRKALEQTERAREIRLRELGEDYSLNFLALRYGRAGRYAEAEALYNASFEGGRPLRPDGTIRPTNYPFRHCNLAGLYLRQGRYREAEDLLVQALACAVWAKEDKWRLLYSRSLATAYFEQGQYDQAGQLCERLLESQRRVMGPEHQDTVATMAGLARVRMRQGAHDEAGALLEYALEISARHASRKHPSTLRYVNQLAILRAKQGHSDEAKALFEEALRGLQARLGDDHPTTLETINDLGVFHRQQGNDDEAESWLRRALAGRWDKLGPDHPHTLESAHQLGVLCATGTRYAEAEPLLLEAFRGRQTRLGPDHPHTIESLGELLNLYESWNKPDEADKWRAKLPRVEDVEEQN